MLTKSKPKANHARITLAYPYHSLVNGKHFSTSVYHQMDA